MDIDKAVIRASGPWVFLKVDKPEELSKGGIILLSTNIAQRIGYASATVLSVGTGKWDTKKKRKISSGLKSGDRVMFRGYLQDANRPSQLDSERCFVHQDDIWFVEDIDAVGI